MWVRRALQIMVSISSNAYNSTSLSHLSSVVSPSGCNIWLRTLVPCRECPPPMLTYLPFAPLEALPIFSTLLIALGVPKTSSWLQVMEEVRKFRRPGSFSATLPKNHVRILIKGYWPSLGGLVHTSRSHSPCWLLWVSGWQQLVFFGPRWPHSLLGTSPISGPQPCHSLRSPGVLSNTNLRAPLDQLS